jgi:GNAT superfamily N-acetyltransferase
MKKITIVNDLTDKITFEPLSEANWFKFVQLFGERGACGNCWCMYYRLNKNDFNEGKADDRNKEAIHQIVKDKKPTGILAFYENQPIAWAAFAPREDFIRLERSRIHKRIDDKPVWSVPCLFIHKDFRGMSVSEMLIKGVIEYARGKNIGIIEAYPAIPTVKKLPDSFLWTGIFKSFERAGFVVADRKSKNRPMVRYYTRKPA